MTMKNGIPNEVIREIFPRKPKRSTLAEMVYARLKKMILKGELRKGQRLVEEQIAHGLNISRTPVRLALYQLKEDQLVVRKREKGTFVV
ncbi:MAG: GntR family transcriptional regulator [Deltaproteobacteria bacterium]|nr:MAG: GntR family transcriptional regulator [Deltaproteobacteria bacterium]